QWDDYAQIFTLIKDGAYVKVKPGAQTAIVNGQSLALQVPVVMKDNKGVRNPGFIVFHHYRYLQWDDYAQIFTLIKDGAYVKVKPGAQ
ncbi:stalk domain-containing protein, partial [Escherichia sp. SS-MK2]